jgi:hypothetical protein
MHFVPNGKWEPVLGPWMKQVFDLGQIMLSPSAALVVVGLGAKKRMIVI